MYAVGSHDQEIEGLPDRTTVIEREFSAHRTRDEHGKPDKRYEELERRVRRITGHEVASSLGKYRGEEFVIE